MKIARHISITLLAITATAAIYGAYHFITDPTGQSLGYSVQDLQHTPFHNYLIPGWLLLIFPGMGSVVSCGLAMQEEESYTSYIMGEGAICTLFVLVQVCMIQRLTFTQIAFVFIGTALFFSGKRIRNKQELYPQTIV